MMALTIEQNVTIDVLNPRRNIIHVVQEDSTRVIRLTLLANNLPYNVEATETETVLKFVEFRKPDGHGGMYDTTSTGETAVQLEDSDVPNVWLIALDGQCFTFPGWTQINIRFETESGRRLHTFPIFVDVSPTASSDTESTDWGELNSIGDMKAAITAMFEETMSTDAKQALLNLLSHVAYADEHGQDYYDELEAALFQTAEIVSISAVFDQGSATIYDTDDLDTLRQYLTVTATYEDVTEREVSAYSLSGTLTVGTSTITVSYGGKTATFDVVVSIGLDSIAYGNLSYRDIFITNNLVSWFGNFENNFAVRTDWTYEDSTQTKAYRLAASSPGSPSVSTTEFNSPGHSLDISTDGTQKFMTSYAKVDDSAFGKDYICAYRAKVSDYVSGKAEVQIFGTSTVIIRNIIAQNTDGWQTFVVIGAPEKPSANQINCTFGALQNTQYGTPNFTAYLDDLIVTPLPTGMTLEQATELTNNYMEMVKRGES